MDFREHSLSIALIKDHTGWKYLNPEPYWGRVSQLCPLKDQVNSKWQTASILWPLELEYLFHNLRKIAFLILFRGLQISQYPTIANLKSFCGPKYKSKILCSLILHICYILLVSPFIPYTLIPPLCKLRVVLCSTIFISSSYALSLLSIHSSTFRLHLYCQVHVFKSCSCFYDLLFVWFFLLLFSGSTW